jgi:ADP-ribose pyrophosphatase YjhB (NUDIX family)/O-acetyl-ADP-ribose deacetylase (regulator of RNase III)
VIEDEAMNLGPIEIGSSVATTAGNLDAKYIIHASTMGMDFKTDEIKIREATASALELADQLKINSIVFPALGCGTGGFFYLAAAKIMSQELLKYLRESKTSLKEVIFCLNDAQALAAFEQGVIKYLEHVVDKLQKGPFTTVDAIIELDSGIVIIERKNPPFGWALPGGFVDYGESLETAVKREAQEETGLILSEVKQFHTYSDPGRDERFHTISTVFIAKAKGKPQAGDDAGNLQVVKPEDFKKINFAFDHQRILADYLEYKAGRPPF